MTRDIRLAILNDIAAEAPVPTTARGRAVADTITESYRVLGVAPTAESITVGGLIIALATSGEMAGDPDPMKSIAEGMAELARRFIAGEIPS